MRESPYLRIERFPLREKVLIKQEKGFCYERKSLFNERKVSVMRESPYLTREKFIL